MSDKDVLIWIDCEMTGLDLERDELIEVAVIATDAQLRPLDAGIDMLIKPSPAALTGMGDFVRDMHTKSGLLDELADAGSLEAATTAVMDYLRKHAPEPGKALLAGNSVGTDKSFLAKDMPEVIEYLHYRVIDVSTVKELARRWYPRAYFNAPQKHGGHRALADIQESILELDYYRRVLFPKDPGPSTLQCQRQADQTSWEGLQRTDGTAAKQATQDK